MTYVDGYLLPIPTRNLPAYARMARMGAKVWMDHGALDYKECLGDDLTSASAFCMPFPKGIRLKAGETVAFSYIVYKSKAHRNKVNAKVMKDPRMNAMCDPKNMPFDCKRMLYGGFKVMVDA